MSYDFKRDLFPFSFSMIDVWFPVIHGQFGEDGHLQKQLRETKLPFIGSNEKTSLMCYDKIASRETVSDIGILQPKYLFFQYQGKSTNKELVEEITQEIGLPLFIKPAKTGSSIGISRIIDEKKILSAIKLASLYDKFILVERAVENCVEYEIAMIGRKSKIITMPGTIDYNDDFYTTKAKYSHKTTKLKVANNIHQYLKDKMNFIALNIVELFGVKDLARIDFLYDKKSDRLYWNELNTIPGFTEKSMFPYLWEERGLNLVDVIEYILKDSI